MSKKFHLKYAFVVAHLLTFEENPEKISRLKKLWSKHMGYYLSGA